MKITYLKAENFAGIKIGTKLNTIEVDFSNNRNPIILLLGENGCGKTSLLSILHPLRGTNDNRSPILKDENGKELKGYKEVHITEGTDSYIVKHTWKPNKSFIEKNGEELNENGNITSFNKILKEELGVDEDYFKVGRLGNNVVNFINLKSSERKKYVGNFLPNIDNYLRLFEIVKNKYSMMNKELNNIASQLGKFPELSILEDKVSSLTGQIEDISNGIVNLEKQKVVQEFSMNQIIEQFKTINIDITDTYSTNNLKKEVNTLKTKLTQAETIIQQYTLKYPNLANYDDDKINETIKDLNDTLNNLDKQSVIYETEYNNLIQSSTDITKRISVTKNKIKEDVTTELEDVNNSIIHEEEKLKKLETDINKENPEIFKYTIPIMNRIKFNASKVLDMIINNIILNYNFNNYDFTLTHNYADVESNIEELETELKEVNKFISYTNNNEKQLEALKKRDKNCKVNTCLFITNSLKFKEEYYDHLDDYNKRKEEIETTLTELYKTREKIAEIINFTKACDECIIAFNNLSDSFIEGYFIKEYFNRNTFIKFLSTGSSNIEKTLNVDSVYDAIQMINDKQVTKTKLETLYARRDNLNSQQENIKLFKEELATLQEESLHIDKQIQENISNSSAITKKENVTKSKRIILVQLQQSREINNSISDELKSNEELLNSVEEAINNINTYNDTISNIRQEIERQGKLKSSIEKEKAKNEKDLNYLEVLLDNKKNLDEKFTYTKLIKDALDSKKGIPLLFINDFLQSITEKTNNLLHLAYEDQFKISFDITEKDFFIKVHRMFTELEDINQASQGETSMTTLSLSLSMIENMIKIYNIIYLDEIDATLSTDNRRLFLTMIEKQLIELGIEQIFIISHNNEFYSYPIDMILFKNHGVDLEDKEFMLNKNVILNLDRR